MLQNKLKGKGSLYQEVFKVLEIRQEIPELLSTGVKSLETYDCNLYMMYVRS